MCRLRGFRVVTGHGVRRGTAPDGMRARGRRAGRDHRARRMAGGDARSARCRRQASDPRSQRLGVRVRAADGMQPAAGVATNDVDAASLVPWPGCPRHGPDPPSPDVRTPVRRRGHVTGTLCTGIRGMPGLRLRPPEPSCSARIRRALDPSHFRTGAPQVKRCLWPPPRGLAKGGRGDERQWARGTA